MKGDNDGPDTYIHRITNNPPLIKERGGKFYIRLIVDGSTYDAEIGGWFALEFFKTVVVPLIERGLVIKGDKE